ncbi:MAG: WYL domain-containing protein [Synergistaceae bacterium]|nr:WYL domain-containing protein [Synergistaceae bacterium]
MRKLLLLMSIIMLLAAGEAYCSEQINVHKTESEREQDFNAALAELGEPLSDLERINFRDAVRKSRNNFLRLYRSQWKAMGMSEKLEKVVNDSIAEKTGELTWGTRGLQLGTNYGDIISSIQETIAFNFTGYYDDFLRDLEEKWADSLQKEIENFYKLGSIVILASDKNPMSRAYIRQNTSAQDRGIKVVSEALSKLQGKYPDLKLTGATAAGGVFMIFRSKIAGYLAKKFGSSVIYQKLAASSAGKLAAGAAPIIGWAMVAWSVYDVASIAWNAESDVQKILNERNNSMYVREMPEVYWEVMEPYVTEVLISSYGTLLNTKKQAQEFANDSRIIKLCEGLNETETMQTAERISIIVGSLGRDKFDYILENFGEDIRNTSPQDFRTLTRILHSEKHDQAREWLNLAGRRYYDLYSIFPRDIWQKFSPDTNSLEVLEWMSKKLTPGARFTASKLSFQDLNWIINELPERFVPQLFGDRTRDSDMIHYEIMRLSELSGKESRRPWQSVWEFRWSKYSVYIYFVIAALLLAVFARILRPFWRSDKADKDSNQVVIYNNTNNDSKHEIDSDSKKFEVKLKILPALIDDVRRITWDVSQTLTPDDDDDNARILYVRLDSLDDIKRWVMKHRENIQVLQPEELIKLIADSDSESESKSGDSHAE